MTQNSIAQKQQTVSIERTFNLPLAVVWKAWTEPESLKKWWGPKEYTCPNATIDFKIGGKYLNSMKDVKGNEIWGTGTYKDIVPQKKIVYTDSFADSKGNIVPASYYKMPGEWALELLVTLEFEEMGSKTKLKMQIAGLPAELTDDCMKGWESSFEKLESYLK